MRVVENRAAKTEAGRAIWEIDITTTTENKSRIHCMASRREAQMISISRANPPGSLAGRRLPDAVFQKSAERHRAGGDGGSCMFGVLTRDQTL